MGEKLRKGTGVAEWLAGYRRASLVSGYPDNRILFAGINLSALVLHILKIIPCHDTVDIDEHYLLVVVYELIGQLFVCISFPTVIVLHGCVLHFLP